MNVRSALTVDRPCRSGEWSGKKPVPLANERGGNTNQLACMSIITSVCQTPAFTREYYGSVDVLFFSSRGCSEYLIFVESMIVGWNWKKNVMIRSTEDKTRTERECCMAGCGGVNFLFRLRARSSFQPSPMVRQVIH
jgi:hypothetical protein